MTAINLGTIGSTGPDDFARTHCKRLGPATSQDAAEHAQRFAKLQSGLILKVLQIYGPQGPKQIGPRIGLKSEQVTRRTKDMQRNGLIFKTGARHDGCDVLAVVV